MSYALIVCVFFFFFKQKTAYEMRISDWSSDVCSSDLCLMADYKAPLRDMSFVLNEVFEAGKLWAQLPALAETVDDETAAAILEEAGKVAAGDRKSVV